MPTPYQHYPPFISLPDNCYKRPRLCSAESDHTTLPATATTYNTTSPNNSPLPADGKPVQFFLVKNDGSEPSSHEASPMRRHFAVTSSMDRSPPQLYIVKNTMTNGLDHDHMVTSSVTSHNESVIQNGRSAQGVIRSFNPHTSRSNSGRTHKHTTDSIWEEIIEGCALSRTFLSAPVVSMLSLFLY